MCEISRQWRFYPRTKGDLWVNAVNHPVIITRDKIENGGVDEFVLTG